MPAMMGAKVARICRHCRDPRKPVNRPRGLCWRCYYAPGVKDMYPVTTKHGRRGVSGENKNRPLDPEPVMSDPGSLARLRDYAYRAAAGYQLFHPLDAK